MNRTDLWLRMRALIFRKRNEQELLDELQFHLEMQTRKNLHRDADAGEAKRRALIRFGGMSRIVEDCRDERRLNLIDGLIRDFRQAIRMLRRNPGFTVVAVLTMALAIGANTAIFSVADAVLFRPLPYHDPGRVHILMMANRQTGARGTMVPYSYLQLIDERHSSVSHVGMIAPESVIVPGNEGAEVVPIATASANYFEILGARAARGRLFDSSDAGAGTAAILSYSAWRQRFGGDESIIGRSVTLGPRKFDVVGVLPSDFVFPTFFLLRKPEVVTIGPPVRPGAAGGTINPIVRLEAGVTREQAQSEINALAATLAGNDPNKANLAPVLDEVRNVLYPFGGPVMKWLLTATTFALLIGCANLANMLMVRFRASERETGVRTALGASRFQLVRPLALEALIVALAGAALALVMTYVSFDALLARVPAVAYRGAPVGISLRVVLFTLGLGLIASLAFSIAPTLHLFRADALALIRQRHLTTPNGRGRIGSPMIIVQVALAIVLVFGAVMTTRTLISILQVPLGFTPENVLSIHVNPRGLTGVPRQEFFIRALETIARRGDVASIGAAGSIAVDSANADEPIRGMESKQPGDGIVHVLPGYFETAAIDLRRGRFLDWNDVRNGTNASVLSESAAAILFPGRNPLGGVFDNGRSRQFTVVGVVADVRKNPEQDPPAFAYVIPAADIRVLSIVVRLRTRDESVVRELRRDVGALAPGVPVSAEWWSDTMDAWVAYRNPRFQSLVLGGLAFLALGLVALGVFGIIAFLVTIRTNEVGIRLALGAHAPSIVKLMVFQAAAPVVIGLLIGIGITRWVSRLAQTQLFQVQTNDPLALAGSALAVLLVAILASYIPARRASRVDPVVALRLE